MAVSYGHMISVVLNAFKGKSYKYTRQKKCENILHTISFY